MYVAYSVCFLKKNIIKIFLRAQRLSEVLDTAVEVTHLEAEDRSSGDAEKKVDDVARGRSRQVLQVIQDQIKKQVSSQVVFLKSLSHLIAFVVFTLQQGRGRGAHAGSGSVQFSELTAGVNRRSAAVCFLEILQLKTWGELELQQDQPYAEIQISSILRAAAAAGGGAAAKRAAAVS